MTNRKSTKKALLSSVLSLFVCLTMLIGTTFAWFTDSVTSTGNIIKSGKLDVELNYTSNFADIEADNWNTVTEQEEAIFNYDKWEPGYVDVKYVQVANVGNLAFKYLLNIVPVSEVEAGVTNLADVIDVYVVAEPTAAIQRSDLEKMTKVGTLSELMADADGAAHGVLLPENGSQNITLNPEHEAIAKTGAVTMGIALKMQESAGNEYQDKTVGEGFTIQLLATQYTWENDSFDNTYDAGLEPVGEDEVIKEVEGIQYLYTNDGEIVLYLIPEDYTGDTVNVMEGTTAIGGYSFYYNDNVDTVVLPSTVTTLNERAFRGTSASNIVLNEGLKTINYQAFRDASNLKAITFPSTLETIGEAAFQLTGLTSVTIPSTVKTLEVGAFRDNQYLESATIEGNPTIANFAFRSCPVLETVMLLGDNVTFSGTSQAFSNADTGKSDNITIYVMNDTVANAVKAANGSCTGYTVELLTTANDTASFKGAIKEGGYIMVTDDVTIDTIGAAVTKGATISGGTISRDTASGNPLQVSTTEPVVFDNVTFESTKGSAVLATRTEGANITVKNSTFNNASAPSTGNTGVQVYAKNVTMTFENCIFNNMPVITNSSYPEGIRLVFNNCIFNWNGDNCPGFIQIANNLKITVDINNCKFAYTTDSQYTTAKTMISYNWPESSTININGLEVVGTRNNDTIWKVCSGYNKVQINTSGDLSYTYNGVEVDFDTYLK